jgi:superfamily II DNA/RNA helicase
MTAENSIPSPVVADVPPTFDLLPLTTEVRRAIDEMGWSNPTPVQIQAYPLAINGRDIIVQSRTGTGKTGAFGLPLVDRLIDVNGGPQALILAPTRELALQSAARSAASAPPPASTPPRCTAVPPWSVRSAS